MPARPQLVDASSCRRLDQEPLGRSHLVGSLKTQKGVLYGVLRIRHATKHSVGNRHHSRPQLAHIRVHGYPRLFPMEWRIAIMIEPQVAGVQSPFGGTIDYLVVCSGTAISLASRG